VLKLCPVAALLGAALKMKIDMEHWWDDKWHGKTTDRTETCPSATLFTINPI